MNLLLLKLPQGSALDSQEKSKTEIISTRLGNSNKIHKCMPEKKGGRIDRGLEREGLEGEELEGEELEGKGEMEGVTHNKQLEQKK